MVVNAVYPFTSDARRTTVVLDGRFLAYHWKIKYHYKNAIYQIQQNAYKIFNKKYRDDPGFNE
jgi:hypothetical protein